MQNENAKSTIYLHRHLPGGKSLLVPCTMGLLTDAQAGQSIELHNRVSKGLSGEIYLPSSESDIVRYVNGDGITVGVWFEDRLVCARTVKTNAEWANEALLAIEEPIDPTGKTALTGYTVVDKEFRGNNVQFLSYFVSESLLAKDFDTILTTVAPKNIFSLLNIMSCGFYITGLRNLYGDYLRYILRKKLAKARPVWTRWHHTIPIRDFAYQQEVLAGGHVGYKIVKKQSGFFVLYGHMGETAPEDHCPFRPRPPIHLL